MTWNSQEARKVAKLPERVSPRDCNKVGSLTFLNSYMRPSLLRVPSGKNSTLAPFFSSSPHCFRHSSWLRRSTRLIITWPGANSRGGVAEV